MGCRLCGSELGDGRSDADHRSAVRGIVAHDSDTLSCNLCGVALPTRESAVLFLEKLKQLAQFGLTSNVRLLSEPSRVEN
jgi:hypothetical protein